VNLMLKYAGQIFHTARSLNTLRYGMLLSNRAAPCGIHKNDFNCIDFHLKLYLFPSITMGKA
jgi:hypothetical protein